KVHWIPVYKLPDVTRYGKGKHISAFIQLGKDEKIATIIPIEEFKNNLIMVTKKGIVKKLPLAVFKRPRRGGILAISLSDDDSLIGVIHAKEEDELLIATRRGMALRFKAAEVRAMGRAAKGVKGIRLKEKDGVIGIVKVEPEKAILTVTEKGFGKRTPAELYRLTHRASIGVRNIICTEKNGFAVAIASVSDKDEVIIATKLGSAIRIKAKEIPLIGRATRGVRLMKLSDQDTVISITVIKEELENV
ncbi:DNA gyrase subunit A, partial [Candidatus Woesearchaeota archaeon]